VVIAGFGLTLRYFAHFTTREPAAAVPASAVAWSLSPSIPASASVNPFLGADFYVRTDFVRSVGWSISAHPELASEMESIKHTATASWILSVDDIEEVSTVLSTAQKESRQTGRPSLPVFVISNLPDRYCRRGFFTTDARLQPSAIQHYIPDFIEPVAAAFAAEPSQRAVVILEPGALIDLTDTARLPCADAADAERDVYPQPLLVSTYPTCFSISPSVPAPSRAMIRPVPRSQGS
jgi:cellulase/cellobiase CelA1